MRSFANHVLPKFYQRYAKANVRRAIVLIWILITFILGLQIRHLRVDFEFEKFFPSGDPDITFYESHLKTFSYDNDYLSLILENDSGVFRKSFLSKVQRLTDSLKALEDIDQVISPTSMQHLVKGPLGVTPVPLIHPSAPTKYHEDSAKIYSHPVFSRFFADDGRSLMVHVTHNHLKDPNKADYLINKIQVLLKKQSFDHYRIVGKLIAQQSFVNLIRQDFSIFLLTALLVSFLLLIVIYRSVKVALIPYLISVTTLVWLLGIMAIFQIPVTILSSLIPPVILFVSSSDAIHLLNSYRSNTSTSFSDRLVTSVKKVFLPTLLTSITTAIGFFSLFTINTLPIRHLGIFTGIGVLLAFVITYVFAPVMIKKHYPSSRPPLFHKKLALWVLKHPRFIVGSTVALFVVATAGAVMLETDAYLLQDLPKDSKVRQDFYHADEHFGGSKPWEMAYWPVDSSRSIWDPKVMAEAKKINAYLKEDYPMERIWSPVTLIQYGNQIISGGGNDHFTFPSDHHYEEAAKVVRKLSSGELPKLISENEKYGRFTGFIPEYGSLETITRDQHLREYLEKYINRDVINFRLTGTTYLIDKSHELLSVNLFKGLLFASVLISLSMGLFFRSARILLVSLLPNLFPLVFTAGVMGWSGMSLKLTTSIIFVVAFGIAVDDTIHFISAYRRQIFQNRVRNLTSTFETAGKSILTTSLVIISGFSLLLFSSFGATFYLGLFLSISLTVALLTDLTFLPLLLHFNSKKNNTGKARFIRL